VLNFPWRVIDQINNVGFDGWENWNNLLSQRLVFNRTPVPILSRSRYEIDLAVCVVSVISSSRWSIRSCDDLCRDHQNRRTFICNIYISGDPIFQGYWTKAFYWVSHLMFCDRHHYLVSIRYNFKLIYDRQIRERSPLSEGGEP
jgi:hypothetical protein